MVLTPGTVFAGYRIVSLLGQGGMGAVYLAQHPRLPRNDALKLLGGGLGDKPDFRARFEREADLVAGLRHPNIVSVYDRGAEGDQLWIAMQHIDGEDAGALVKAGPATMTVARAVAITRDVAKALDYAHQRGLLHRDVKPANIIIAPPVDRHSRESAMLMDFGIARALASQADGLTLAGDMIATVGYAAPEQLSGRHVDRRADVYALGCTFYEMLVGVRPFRGDRMEVEIVAHLTAPPPRPSQARPGLPPAIDAVVARALAKNPEERYSTCHELAEAAAHALQVDPRPQMPPMPPMPPRPLPPPPPAPKSRRPLVIGATVAAAVVVIGGGTIIAVTQSGSDTATGPTTSTTSSSAITTSVAVPTGPTAKAVDGSFVVSLPPGWKEGDRDNRLLFLVGDGTPVNMIFSENGSATRGATVQASAELNAQDIVEDPTLKAVMDPGGIESTTIDGETARRFTYSFPEGNGHPSGRGRQLYVRHDGVEYIITFTGATSAFNLAVADYESIMDSLRWGS